MGRREACLLGEAGGLEGESAGGLEGEVSEVRRGTGGEATGLGGLRGESWGAEGGALGEAARLEAETACLGWEAADLREEAGLEGYADGLTRMGEGCLSEVEFVKGLTESAGDLGVGIEVPVV